ncbi:beta-mannanase [Thermoleophilia bacterium SCSIO 60948]|nr:beta-mannanase [Thermoleophilia bacterium SCSIO 60948]
MRFRIATLALVGLACAAIGLTSAAGSPDRRGVPAGCDLATGSNCVLIPPPDGRIYHAAFPDFGGAENRVGASSIRRFERLADRPIAWAYFSDNWFDGKIRFPDRDVDEILSADRLPFIRLMARSDFGRGPDPNFTMHSIADGEWDAELADWCDGAAAVESPLLAEFGTEVNGDWFPWNGRWNRPDGPAAFRDAYRRIVDTCRDRGADNITWFFHVDVGSSPRADWNEPWDYYPGDEYVDWIGLSDYGPLKPGESWRSFHARMDNVIYDLLDRIGSDKPLAVLEYGATEDRRKPTAKANWIRAATRTVARGHWPEIHGLSYWHEAWQNGDGSHSNLHVDSSRRSLRAYRRGVAGERFSSRPRFGSR